MDELDTAHEKRKPSRMIQVPSLLIFETAMLEKHRTLFMAGR